ncbi:restriction endonuclease subunit S [Anaerovorax odorimutans]|uniref:restriction endonuclease subunit S n=1 Tax=Anaerovorax odorimutans TaxID=109327 RepID=UPI000406A5A6|nr:restriction endonuclease subunit S [Anaerovorax odorimutans]
MKYILQECITDIIDNRGKNPKNYYLKEKHPVIDNYLIKGDLYPNLNEVKRYIDEVTYLKFLRTYLEKDDVLMTLVGNGIANVSLAPSKTVVIIQNTIAFRTDKSKLLQRYLYYYLKNIYQELLNFNRGSSQPSIKKTDILAMEINIPDIQTQQKTVNILSSLDEKIELNNKLNDNLEQLIVNLFNMKFADYEKSGKISEICERVYSGGTPSTKKQEFWNGELNWLSSGETRDRFIIGTEKYITQLGADNSSTKLAHKYDVVIASAGQGFTRGQTSLLLLDTYINQSVIAITGTLSAQIYVFANLIQRYKEMRILSDGTSTRGSLTTKIISGMDIYIPTQAELDEFLEIALPIINQIELLSREQKALVDIRDCLLPKLMLGDMDISEIELEV